MMKVALALFGRTNRITTRNRGQLHISRPRDVSSIQTSSLREVLPKTAWGIHKKIQKVQETHIDNVAESWHSSNHPVIISQIDSEIFHLITGSMYAERSVYKPSMKKWTDQSSRTGIPTWGDHQRNEISWINWEHFQSFCSDFWVSGSRMTKQRLLDGRYTCLNIDGIIWGLVSKTRPNVFARGPNCIISWRNGLRTGSPNLYKRNMKPLLRRKSLKHSFPDFYKRGRCSIYLHATEIYMEKLVGEARGNIKLLLCRHCSLKQPWCTQVWLSFKRQMASEKLMAGTIEL